MITDELADSFNGPDADEVCRVMGIGKDRRALYDELVDQTDVELTTHAWAACFPARAACSASLSDCATMAILTNGSQRYCEACIETFALSPYIALHSGFVSGVTKAQRIRQWQHELNAADRDRRGRPSDGYSKRARGGRLRRRRDLWHGRAGRSFPARIALCDTPAGGCGLLSCD